MADYINTNADQGHALGWDDKIDMSGSSFTLLPEGEYDFTVTGFDRGYHNGSDKLPACPKATMHIQIAAPQGRTTIKHNLFLHTKCRGMIGDFFVGVGLRQRGGEATMDFQAAVGRSGRCKVGIRRWRGRDGDERESNEIKYFIAPAATAPAPTPGYKAGEF